MKPKTLALLLFGLLAPGVCAAQSLKPGTWTGTVIPPEGEPALVTYDVTVNGDSLGIVIHAGEHGDFVTEGARFADGKLTFRFSPGPVVSCTLTQGDKGIFAGRCTEEDGSAAQVTMVPPAS